MGAEPGERVVKTYGNTTDITLLTSRFAALHGYFRFFQRLAVAMQVTYDGWPIARGKTQRSDRRF